MSKYKVTIETDSASGPQAEFYIKHFLRDTDCKVIKATKICNPKPRQKWYIYIDGKIDGNTLFCGGVTKAKAQRWMKEYKKAYINNTHKYVMTTVLQK